VQDDDDHSKLGQSHAVKMAIEGRVQLTVNAQGATSSSWGMAKGVCLCSMRSIGLMGSSNVLPRCLSRHRE
jgi:hypothetical protein